MSFNNIFYGKLILLVVDSVFALGLHPSLFANMHQNILFVKLHLFAFAFACFIAKILQPERSISRPIQRLPAATAFDIR